MTGVADEAEEERPACLSGWATFGDEPKPDIQWSDCRQLQLVKRGYHYTIWRLQEQYPHLAWQYANSKQLVHYHFDCASLYESEQLGERPAACRPDIYVSHSTDAVRVPPFYAIVNYKFSPVEFSVQPKQLDRHRERIEQALDAHMQREQTALTYDQMLNGVPCAVHDGLKWRRARICDLPDHATPDEMDSVPIEYVDYGSRAFMPHASLLALPLHLARLPPLSLRCKINGVSINDLLTERCDAFLQMLGELDNTVRVELLNSADSEPYAVNLWHPTVSGLNLGAKYYPDPRTRGERVRPEKPEEPEFDDDYSSSEEESVSKAPPQYIRWLDRLPKPPTSKHSSVLVRLSHIESSRHVYMQSEQQRAAVVQLEERMLLQADQLFTRVLSASELVPGLACATQHEGRWLRCLLHSRRTLQAVDHGFMLHNVDPAKLFALPAQFNAAPLVYVGRLSDFHQDHPHVSVTRLMRRLWQSPEQECKAVFSKRQHGPPFELSLSVHDPALGGWLDCSTQLDIHIRRSRILLTKQLVPYDPQVAATALWPIDTGHVYYLKLHNALLKGILTYTDFD